MAIEYNKSVTLADIAKIAKVSTATVSMVLRGTGRISPDTRTKVLDVIDKMGYIYNQTAANLRKQHSNLVGLLINDITNPFYADLTAGLSQEMDNKSLLLFLANSEESAVRQQKLVDSLIQNNIRGIILCAAQNTPQSFYNTLGKRGLHVITVVRPVIGSSFDFIGTDNFLGSQMATQHLISLGHKNIAFIGGNPNSINRSQRLGGYMAKLAENSINMDVKWNIPCEAKLSAGALAAQKLLHESPEITAIVCYQDIVALGVMQTLKRFNREIGKDIAIVGFDDITESALVEPSLTTISVAAREIGKKAGELLYSRINGNDETIQNIILPPKLIIRESCGGI